MYSYGQDVQDTGEGIPPNAEDQGTCATCADVTGETGGQMLVPPSPGVSTEAPAEVPITATPEGSGAAPEGPDMGPCDLRAPWWAWLAGGLALGFYAARRRA